MKNFANTLVLLVVCLALPACGLLNTTKKSSTRTFTDQERAQNFFNSSTITCGDMECPSFVGGLYSYTGLTSTYDVASCSLTLLSENTVLTNEHCLPDGISRVGDLCLHRIRIVFPKTKSHPEEPFECEEVIAVAQDTPRIDGPDWAILRFTGRTNRKPVKLDVRGIEQNKDVVLNPVFFDLNAAGNSRGVVQAVRCRANTNMKYSREQAGPQSALFNISQCTREIISGNSGTGILSSSQSLVGVYSFGMHPDSIKSNKRDYPTLIDNFGGGTNLYCITPLSGVEGGKCLFDYSGRRYHKLATVNDMGRTIEASPSFKTVGEDALRQAESMEEMQWAEFDPGLSETFDIASHEDTFAEAKQDTRDMWLKILFPVVPTCIDRETAETSKTVRIPMRTPVGYRGEKVVEPTMYTTRDAQMTMEDFDVVAKSSYAELTADWRLHFETSLKDLFSITSWNSFRLKVEYCD